MVGVVQADHVLDLLLGKLEWLQRSEQFFHGYLARLVLVYSLEIVQQFVLPEIVTNLRYCASNI